MASALKKISFLVVGFYFLFGVQAVQAERIRVAYVHVFDDAPVVIARDKRSEERRVGKECRL